MQHVHSSYCSTSALQPFCHQDTICKEITLNRNSVPLMDPFWSTSGGDIEFKKAPPQLLKESSSGPAPGHLRT